MPRSQHALLTATALCLLTAGCVVSAGKFDAYKTCDVCIAAGFGWHAKKGRCGGYPNKVCATGTKPAPSKAPPSLSTLTELTDKTFEGAVGSGIVLVNYYGSSCQSCDEVKSALERAADQVGAAKIVRVDASAQSGAATDYGILGKTIPSLVLFRDGEMVTQVDPTIWSHHLPSKITEKIVTYLNVHAKTVEDGEEDGEWDDDDEDDEDEPEILRFSMANAQSLMSHRLKHQLVLFMSEKDKRSGKAVEQLEEALKKGGYADKALGLHIPTDIRENDQVLDRFFVTPKKTPALRLAVMYPTGDGLSVYAPKGHKAQKGGLKDGALKGVTEFTNALADHFAGNSEPLLRSEPSPSMNHPIIVDLVGKTVDNFLVKPNTHTLLLLYWTNCQHCEDLMPAYESVALKLKEAHKTLPSGEAPIMIGRIEGTRNDIGHPRIFAGSYPMIYFLASDDKDYAIRLDTENGMYTEDAIMSFLEDNTWLGEAGMGLHDEV